MYNHCTKGMILRYYDNNYVYPEASVPCNHGKTNTHQVRLQVQWLPGVYPTIEYAPVTLFRIRQTLGL